MAMAANHVIAEVSQIVEAGDLVPECIHTPGAFVKNVVSIDISDPLYAAIEGRYEHA